MEKPFSQTSIGVLTPVLHCFLHLWICKTVLKSFAVSFFVNWTPALWKANYILYPSLIPSSSKFTNCTQMLRTFPFGTFHVVRWMIAPVDGTSFHFYYGISNVLLIWPPWFWKSHIVRTNMRCSKVHCFVWKTNWKQQWCFISGHLAYWIVLQQWYRYTAKCLSAYVISYFVTM